MIDNSAKAGLTVMGLIVKCEVLMTDSTVDTVNSNMENAAPEQQPSVDFEQERRKVAENSFKAGYAKAKTELEKQMAAQSQVQPETVPTQTQEAPQSSEGQGLTRDDVFNLIKELNEQQHQQHLSQQQELEGQRIVQSLDNALVEAEKEKPGLLENVGKVNWLEDPRLHGLLREAEKHPNKAFILEHFANNPLQMGNFLSVPENLQGAAMKRVADSLRINDESKNVDVPTDTLSRMNTSAVGVGNGERTVSDYKRDPRYRG